MTSRLSYCQATMLSRLLRLKQSIGRTWLRSPELLEILALTEEQARLLNEFQRESQQQQNDDVEE